MPKQVHRLGVVAVSRRPVTRWGKRGFAASAVLPQAPATPPMSRLSPPGDVETWYVGPAELVLHSGDAGHHRDNLLAARPSLWVALRPGDPPVVAAVTADPYEGEGFAGDPGLVVEAVPMPEALRAAVAAFVAAHHVEQVFHKRRRKPVDPQGLSRSSTPPVGPARGSR